MWTSEDKFTMIARNSLESANQSLPSSSYLLFVSSLELIVSLGIHHLLSVRRLYSNYPSFTLNGGMNSRCSKIEK